MRYTFPQRSETTIPSTPMGRHGLNYVCGAAICSLETTEGQPMADDGVMVGVEGKGAVGGPPPASQGLVGVEARAGGPPQSARPIVLNPVFSDNAKDPPLPLRVEAGIEPHVVQHLRAEAGLGILASVAPALGVGASAVAMAGASTVLLHPSDILSLKDGEDGRPVLTVTAAPPEAHHLEANDLVIQGNAVDLSVKGTTVIGRAVLNNQAAVQLNAFSFLTAILLKLETVRAERLNSEDAAVFENLKLEIETFLAANAASNEASIVTATSQIAKGLRAYWDKEHIGICGKAVNLSLFAAGLSFCALAGAFGAAGVVTVGVLIGGKDVTEALKAAAKLLPRADD